MSIGAQAALVLKSFDDYDCIIDMCLFKPEQFELIKDSIPTDTNYIFVSSGAVDYIDTNEMDNLNNVILKHYNK